MDRCFLSGRIITLICLFLAQSHYLSTQTTLNTIEELRALPPGVSTEVTVLGYYEAGDWGEPRIYKWTEPSNQFHNGGTIIAPHTSSTGRWIMRVTENFYNVQWFGARGDNSDSSASRNSDAIENALRQAASSHIKRVFIPEGIYKIGRRLTITGEYYGVELFGIIDYETITFAEMKQRWPAESVLHSITWNEEEFQFRVVDESRSSVIKRVSNLGLWSGNQNLVIVSAGNGEVNFTLRDIAFNGNRQEGESPNDFMNNVLIYSGGVLLDNCASYNARRSGFGIRAKDVTFNNILSYNNSFHGFMGSGGSFDLPVRSKGFLETHSNGHDGGMYGIDVSGDDDTEMGYWHFEEIWSHHNWAGMKTTPATRGLYVRKARFSYNRGAGFTQTGNFTDERRGGGIVFGELWALNNGSAGVNWWRSRENNRANLVVVDGNGAFPGSAAYNGIIGEGATVGKIISRNYRGQRNFSFLLDGLREIEVSHIQIYDNEAHGLEVKGNVVIRSGILYNNNNSGIFIHSGRSLTITNVKFGNSESISAQTGREIYGDGKLTYSGLDFSESLVPEHDRIRVAEANEIANVTISYPYASTEIFKEDGITIEIQAYAPNATSERIELYANDLLLGETTQNPYVFHWDTMDEGYYTLRAIGVFSNNEQLKSNEITVSVRARTKTQILYLQEGWNTVSTYVNPLQRDVSLLTHDIRDNLLLLVDYAGNVFWPEINIDEIGVWDYRKGYQVFMLRPDTLNVRGLTLLPREEPIKLSPGWNLISYILDRPMFIESAMSSLGNSIEIVTNNFGDIYWPRYGINEIGNMKPGEGYRIFANTSAILVYPTLPANNQPWNSDIFISSTRALKSTTPSRYVLAHQNTGKHAFLLVKSNSFKDGDEVGVWTHSGELVGSGVASSGRVAINIWGKDEIATGRNFGAQRNEGLHLSLWSKNDQREYSLQIKTLRSVNDELFNDVQLVFEPNSILIADVDISEAIPLQYSLHQNFPNPFNPTTVIRYQIPHDSSVKLEVFNLLGQTITVLVDEKKTAGSYEVVFNADRLASGVYFYRLTAGNYSDVRRMILLR